MNTAQKPKLSKSKSETLNTIIEEIYHHYNFTRFEIQWEISAKRWELTIGEITPCYEFLHVYKDEPNVFYIGLCDAQRVDMTDPNWKQTLFDAIDAERKSNEQIEMEREANGFNDMLRRAGLFGVFH